jgi:hypothetical protein
MSVNFLFRVGVSSCQSIERKDNLRFFQFYFNAHFFNRFEFISGLDVSDHRGFREKLSNSISFGEFLWVFLSGFGRGRWKRHWFGGRFRIRGGHNPHWLLIN